MKKLNDYTYDGIRIEKMYNEGQCIATLYFDDYEGNYKIFDDRHFDYYEGNYDNLD